MHKKSVALRKYGMLFLAFLMFYTNPSSGQVTTLPYSPHLYQKMDDLMYSPSTRYHTAIKPYILKDALKVKMDSIQSSNPYDSNNWFLRKIFNEHLVQVEKEDYTFYADFLPDMVIGKDLGTTERNTWINTRGIQAGLSIKDKFTLYTSFYENQGVFPDYLDQYIVEHEVVPGQAYTNLKENNKKDWMYVTATMVYDVNKYLNVSLGYDKAFIGDGYRSMLLSDFSSNFANLRLTGTVGNVQYASIWGYMNDPVNPRTSLIDGTVGDRLGDGAKWGAFQYLDWNVTNRFSVGLFQSVIWANYDDAGRRGFDFAYIFPVIVTRAIERNNRTSPDKMFVGLNSKYKVLNNLTTYGQFMLGEFVASEFFSGKGYARNKFSGQIGVKGFDIFGVKNLNFLTEYNFARPYMYAHIRSASNYSNNAEPLAHPQGANFREVVGLANYAWKRWNFSLQGMIYQKGLDTEDGLNMGGDIFQDYRTAPNEYGNDIGQGVKNNVFYADAKVAYVLNPKYNLRLEAGYTQRYAKAHYETPEVNKTNWITFGLRSSFRAIYNDL
ncbi:gliding motility protein RemB [Sphingobacterium sp. LRF_L2]|uniref:gliding motility protein RemB n=1 Tax=Sphingobacterium sp. LRF_L2 TaxID=3369421 RepID=UPI003F5F300E